MHRFVIRIIMALFLAGCRHLPPPEAIDVSERQTAKFLEEHNLAGKVALVQFGMVGCSVSETGLTNMIVLCREKKIPGLSYFRVEESPDQEAADGYYAKMPPGFPVCTDPGSSLARAFQATTIPCCVLVDKFGHVRHRGSFPSERLSEWAAKLNAEQTDPGPDVPLLDSVQLDVARLLATTRLPEVGGKALQPLAKYAGKRGLMIVFVDTSCPFARQIIGEIPDASGVLKKRKIATLLVNIDDDEQDVKDFYGKRATGGVPVAYDSGSDTRLKWRVESVPTIVLVNSKGELLYRGAAVWQKVARAGEKGLNLRPGSIVFNLQGTEFG